MPPRFPSVLVLGAIAVDRIARTDATPAIAAASNPGTARSLAGGVGRNVAEALARLGVPVAIAGAIGADGEGERLVADLAALGVDVSGVTRIAGASTASYNAVFDGAGELVIGVADMSAAERFDADMASAALAAHPQSLVVADANLAEATLARLFGANRPVVAAAVSPAKAFRLKPHLPKIAALFLNRREATALLETDVDDERHAAGALFSFGAKKGILTNGSRGIFAWNDGAIAHFAAIELTLASANGAGDSLIAGTLAAWRNGASFIDAARTGLAAAALTLASEEAVSPRLCEALSAINSTS